MSRVTDAFRKSRSADPGSSASAGAAEAVGKKETWVTAEPPWDFAESAAAVAEPMPVAASSRVRVVDVPAAVVARATRGAASSLAMGEILTSHPSASPVLVEQFRKLAGALHQAQLEHGTRSVSVASATASEGKTVTAVNLALTLAESYGRRVLLIDADLRSPSVHASLDCPLAPGLTDLISDTAAPLPVSQVTSKLSVMTAGTMTRDPISVLSSEGFRQVIVTLAENFDWLVLDIPPVGPLPDANLLTSVSDTTVLVVQVGCAAYPVVQRAAEAIGPDRILGVVLNMVAEKEIGTAYGDPGEYYAHARNQFSLHQSGEQ